MSDAKRCDACGTYADAPSFRGWIAVTSIASGLDPENVMPMFELCGSCSQSVTSAFMAERDTQGKGGTDGFAEKWDRAQADAKDPDGETLTLDDVAERLGIGKGETCPTCGSDDPERFLVGCFRSGESAANGVYDTVGADPFHTQGKGETE